MATEIVCEILEDGTVRWKTGRVPDKHHAEMDVLQAELEAALGGPVTRTSTAAKPRNTHHKDHLTVNE